MMMPAPGMSADVWDNTTDLLASINPFGKKVRISPITCCALHSSAR
jgi:hypothetical protein